jgi:aminoglycoside 6'-N-acetyltransferase I
MSDNGAAAMTFRHMVAADIPHYCLLFQSVFSLPPWREKWALEKINAGITKVMCKKEFFGMTAESASGNIGYCTGLRIRWFPIVFYLDQLFVHPEYQGKKIGKELLYRTILRLKDAGISGIVLLTKPQSAAERFYSHNEFKTILPALHIRRKSILYRKI